MLKRFKTSLGDYKQYLATAQQQKVDMKEAVTTGKHVYSYNHNKAKYLGDNMKKNVQELRDIITNLYSHSTNPTLGEMYSKIMVNVRLLEEKYYDPVRSLPIVELIETQLKPLEQDEFLRKEMEEFDVPEESEEGKKEEVVVDDNPREVDETKPKEMNVELPEINLPFLPAEIMIHVVADVNELERCYNSGCYRSSVIMCGRIMEAALHRKYFEITGNDALEKNPGIGLGKLIAKLSEMNVRFDPGLKNQIHLINQVRISSVHVKQDLFKPNQTQSQAIILYTLDVLHKLFGKSGDDD